ncbi:uncharacterized protein F4812DRAFT_427643 [Daldinia caldariorum]|uniref:uncharacterized protein n=1 Tax=Daldinia caldariorum TaxID=326644 RepID=UPI0020087198|nr:uncharacterized protein F4812DRAFT_427643 [Daldinia caldariorum]KAI1467807.1 hypothetical protein F4812DRAFT_427643 [Daldinia caldariorum]
MPGPAVKQQHRKASAKPNVATPKQSAPSSINGFTRVSKSVTSTDVKKEVALTPKKSSTIEPLTPASRKRPIRSIEEKDSSADERPIKRLSLPVKSQKAVSQPAKRGRGRPSKARPEPILKKRTRSPSISDSDESAVNAGALLKRLRLESSPSRSSTPFSVNTPITEPDIDENDFVTSKNGLPEEVLALIDLHSSLLKTLTLHYAHNGSNVPADLRVLCPNVSRAWGRKQVTEADIRLCLGVLNFEPKTTSTKPLFSLSDYGRGKICIEIDSVQHESGRPLDEKKLNDTFHDNISSLWTRFSATNGLDVSAFISTTLPRAPVTLCESVAKAAPVLSKGQKRLEELKQGMVLKKQEKEAKSKPPQLQQQQQSGDVQMSGAGAAPKMSVLDRIRLKSLQKSSLPAGNLSPAQLQRRAALQRAPEVAGMLGMLSRAAGQGGRVSFTMAATLEKLKDSLRMGVSREEGAACVRLLASEVAPEWARVVVIGGRENVVLETDRQPNKADVEGRVRGLLEQE